MGDINANSSNLYISRQMMDALKSPTVQRLINQIMSDGIVDNKTDEAALKALRAHLESAAKADDGKIDGDEDSLLDALDSTGWFGTNENVVKGNLSRIQDMVRQLSNFDANQVNFSGLRIQTQDGIGGMFGGEQSRVLRLRDLGETAGGETPAAPAETPAATPATPVAENTTPATSETPETRPQEPIASTEGERPNITPAAPPSSIDPNTQPSVVDPAQVAEDKLRQQQLQQTRGQLTSAQERLKSYLSVLEQALTPPSSISDSKLEQDIQNAVKSQDLELLAKLGLADQDLSQPIPPEKMQAAVEKYRSVLLDTIKAYRQDPKEENFSSLKSLLYDKSYIFTSVGEGVTEAQVNAYNGMNTALQDVSQKQAQFNAQAKSIGSGTYNVPSSVESINSNLNYYNSQADDKVISLAANALLFTEQMKGKVDPAELDKINALVNQLVTRDADGKISGVKSPPAGQAHLDVMNKLWAEVEQTGLKAGLGDNFFQQNVGSALNQVQLNNSNTPNNQALLELLKKKPELASKTELLKALSQPGNEALLKAVSEGNTADISKYFSEFRQKQMSFTLGFGLGGLGFGLGMSYMAGLGMSYMGGFGMGDAHQIGKIGLSSGFSMAPPPSGGDMNLWGISENEVKDLATLLQGTDAKTRQLVLSNNSKGQNALIQFIQDTPELQGVRDQMAAKEKFDRLFWESGSSLEEAQRAVTKSIQTQQETRDALAVAKETLGALLQDNNLLPEERTQLQNQLKATEDALGALSQNKPLPENNPALKYVLQALSNKDNTTTLGDALKSSVRQAKVDQEVATYQGAIDNLQTVLGNEITRTQVLSKLPPDQAAELQKLIDTGAITELANIIKLKDLDSANRAQVGALLQGLNETVTKAQDPNATPESLQQASAQINQLKSISQTYNTLKSAVTSTRLAGAMNEVLNQSVQIQNNYQQKNNQPIPPAELETQLKTVLDKIIEKDKSIAQEESARASYNQDSYLYASIKYDLAETKKMEERIANLSRVSDSAAARNYMAQAWKQAGLSNDSSIAKTGIRRQDLESLSPTDLDELIKAAEAKKNDLATSNLSEAEKAQAREALQTVIDVANAQRVFKNNNDDLLNRASQPNNSPFAFPDDGFNGDVSDIGAISDIGAVSDVSAMPTGGVQHSAPAGATQGVAPTNGVRGRTPNVEQARTVASRLAFIYTCRAFPGMSDDEFTIRMSQYQREMLLNANANPKKSVDEIFKSAFGVDLASLPFAQRTNARLAQLFAMQEAGLSAKPHQFLDERNRILTATLFSITNAVNEGKLSPKKAQTLLGQLDTAFSQDSINPNTLRVSVNQLFQGVGLAPIGQGNGQGQGGIRPTSVVESSDGQRPRPNNIGIALNEGVTRVLRDTARDLSTTSREDFMESSAIVSQGLADFLRNDAKASGDDTYVRELGLDQADLSPAAQSLVDKADLSPAAQSLVDKADALANAVLSPKPTVDSRDALAGLLKDFLDNIRNLDFQTRKLVMSQFAKRLINNMITRLYAEKNRENAKNHEKIMDLYKDRMKEAIERTLQASEAQASNGQAAMAVSGDLGAKTGMAVANAGVSDQALRQEMSDFLEPAVQDGVLSRVQKQKILQALFEGSSVTGQEGVMAILNRFQQMSSIVAS